MVGLSNGGGGRGEKRERLASSCPFPRLIAFRARLTALLSAREMPGAEAPGKLAGSELSRSRRESRNCSLPTSMPMELVPEPTPESRRPCSERSNE